MERDPHFPSYEETVKHVSSLFERNAETPWQVRTVTLDGVRTTRRSVIEHHLRPLLDSASNHGSLADLVARAQLAVARLKQLDVFEEVGIDLDAPRGPNAGRGDHGDWLDVKLVVKERSRLRAETGTQVGNNEGNLRASLAVRNLAGGGESAALNVSFGTKTPSSFEGVLNVPNTANPAQAVALTAHQLHRSNQATASHDELARQAGVRLTTPSPLGHHTFTGTLTWRHVFAIPDSASLSVRHEAGHSLKAAVGHSWVLRDTRDSASLPTAGSLLKVDSELAGVAQIGDVRHHRHEVEAVAASRLFGSERWSVAACARAGVLAPLAGDVPRISDRMPLGGPTSVRGFVASGLGPRDGNDALGATTTYSAGVSLFGPVPGLGHHAEWLKLHAWANAGAAGMVVPATRESLERFVRSAAPSVSAGVGLAVRHPAARLEINFSVPVAVHKGDQVSRGWGVGIGINFL
ncbi:surface antigen-domain-containing protein [Blastocladiella britannica]|nr:surface antigen-domain-containing protein [Blastocladiella britannica]